MKLGLNNKSNIAGYNYIVKTGEHKPGKTV